MSDYCEHQWKDEQKIEQLEAEIERLRTALLKIGEVAADTMAERLVYTQAQ